MEQTVPARCRIFTTPTIPPATSPTFTTTHSRPFLFKGQIIEPSNDYSYDAIYRLIEATGREHLGQLGGSPIPHSYNDAGRVGVVCADAGRFAPNDQNAMGRYCEKYVYDAVGNFEQMSHHRSCLAAASWRRTYFYEEASLIEPAKQSNRLSRTEVGSNNLIPEPYSYDPHGNMIPRRCSRRCPP